jgi:hypothetical protein
MTRSADSTTTAAANPIDGAWFALVNTLLTFTFSAMQQNPIFELVEYVVAERAFIGGTLSALPKARDPLLSEIPVEPTSRIQTLEAQVEASS